MTRHDRVLHRRARSALEAALCVAAALAFAPAARADAGTVVVHRGDALSLLAGRFGVTVEELRRWNDLDSDRILAGQELRLAPPDGAQRSASSADSHPGPVADEDGDVLEDQAEAGASAHASGRAPSAPDDAPDADPAPTAEASTSAPSPQLDVRYLHYRVRRGDTLSGVALSQGTTLEALRAANPDLRRDRIREGAELNIPPPDAPRRVHRVRRGESLGSIAARFRVRPRELLRWNPGLRPARLQLGQELVVYSEIRESLSESIGKPDRGTLAHAERLPPNPGYSIHEPSRAWATLETTEWLSSAVDAVREQFPGGPRIAVHDLSARRGGRLRGHRSHQSGRDADLSYYQRRCGSRPCPFHRVDPSELDLARQWALLRHWLERDEVEYVFIDYGLQRALYRYAEAHGATRTQLSRWFQFPRGRRHRLGIIRHFRGHRDHLHVRFVCPDTDEDCR